MARSESLRALAVVSASAADAASSPFARSPRINGRTLVFFIVSPRPLSVKSFLARLVCDFLRLDTGAACAFDLDPEEGGLADYLPSITGKADIGTTPGQVALFDRLIVDDGVGKVVDVRHSLFERLVTVMVEIGFMEETRHRGVEPVILFAADLHPAAVKAYAGLRQLFPRCVLVPVFNEAVLKGRKARAQFPFSRVVEVPLQIPMLPPALKMHADRASFAEFHSRLPIEVPIGHALELRSWTKRVFLEFREFELRLLMEKLRASLR